MSYDSDISNINKDLWSRGVRLRLEQRGEGLYVRGPLPNKEAGLDYKNQRISLQLPANSHGIKRALELIDLILLQLQHNQFNWESWSRKNKNETSKSTKENNTLLTSIQEFESHFFSDPIRNRSKSSSYTTWIASYKPYLKRLKVIAQNRNKNPNASLFQETLSSYKVNSRSRQQCSTALGAFAKYLNIDLPEDWKKNGSGYGINKSRFRDLPSDNSIEQFLTLIPNPKWRIVYGLMATYGLRNHEVFFSDFSSLSKNGDYVLRVLPNTKTGEHQVWPFHPKWIDYFGLRELNNKENLLPLINTDLSNTTLQKVGRRVSEQFRRYKLPITPYDLRHAWAIRTIHIGLPDTVSARMMGHSVAIHTKTYHHWITHRDQQEAVDKALSNKY